MRSAIPGGFQGDERTGFFPFHGFTPTIGVGIISLVVLTITSVARYVRHLAGAWR